jgi:hypothetical protein
MPLGDARAQHEGGGRESLPLDPGPGVGVMLFLIFLSQGSGEQFIYFLF